MCDIAGIVQSRCSMFMGHLDTDGLLQKLLLQKLNDYIQNLNLAKLVQISTEGAIEDTFLEIHGKQANRSCKVMANRLQCSG